MKEHIARLRDFYHFKPHAKIVQAEFGYYCLDKWKRDGHINGASDLNKLFGYDENAKYMLTGVGGCEAEFSPRFKEEVLEDRGRHELVRDFAGRSVLYFKGRRQGFMPEYVDHPVKDMGSWERDVKWRLDPASPERFINLAQRMEEAVRMEKEGGVICQIVVGAYMYLRSLIGPEELFYKFYDDPDLLHDCMKTWFELADRVISEHQKFVTLDEILFDEDICYNHGLLVSPDMIREFLFPYYQQLIMNVKKRQTDQGRKLFIHVATDGNCLDAIELYKEIGIKFMSPFEVASGCDVVEIRRKYPELLMSGGIDKRILAESKDAIDREIERIMPFMTAYGGYIPTCDHGVPEEVPFENYMHYRKRMLAF